MSSTWYLSNFVSKTNTPTPHRRHRSMHLSTLFRQTCSRQWPTNWCRRREQRPAQCSTLNETVMLYPLVPRCMGHCWRGGGKSGGVRDSEWKQGNSVLQTQQDSCHGCDNMPKSGVCLWRYSPDRRLMWEGLMIGDTIPGQVVLRDTRKQSGQGKGSQAFSNIPFSSCLWSFPWWTA